MSNEQIEMIDPGARCPDGGLHAPQWIASRGWTCLDCDAALIVVAQHNHQATGVYPNCPGCGTVT